MNNDKMYGIWLMPDENARKKFSNIIKELSKKYNTPDFDPHISLVGRLYGNKEELISKTQILAEKIKSFRIQLGKTDHKKIWNMAIVILTEKNQDIMKAHKKAVQMFSLGEKEFTPHLSVLYGSLDDNVKEKIIKEIGEEFNDSIIIDKIQLFESSSEITVDIVKTWKRIKTFPLKKE